MRTATRGDAAYVHLRGLVHGGLNRGRVRHTLPTIGKAVGTNSESAALHARTELAVCYACGACRCVWRGT